MSLRAMESAARRRAEAVPVDEETLAAWYPRQLAAARAHRDALAEAHMANLEQAEREAWKREDARWEQLWLLDARLRYSAYGVELLVRRQHVLSCPNHGVRGVEAEGVDWEGLADRGLLTGEGALAWRRYCERCAMPGIEADAARLTRNWRLGEQAAVTGRGEVAS